MKLGITMEGGANRTIFSCGVVDAFLDENIMPDYFIGVSAGIAFGVSYLSRQKGRNLRIAKEYVPDKRYMGMPHLLDRKKRNFFNVDFVFGEIPDKLLPFDYDAFADFKGEAIAVATNIHSGKAEYLKVPADREKMNAPLVASCAIPLLFQPVKVGNHYYLDGGISDSIPFKKAIEAGCDKNIVILTRTRDYRKKNDSVVKISSKMYCRYPKIAEGMLKRAEQYNTCRDELQQLEQEGKVFVIAPEDTLGVGRTEKNIDKLERLYNKGYDQAKVLMPKLKEYLKA